MFNRRSFLKTATAGACALPLVPRALQAAGLKVLRVQLAWIPNVEYATHWIALEKGYFRENGLDVRPQPGGPNAPDPLVVVAAGSADAGGTDWLRFLDAVARGNDFVIFAATFQSSVLGIISLKRKPILTPQDIVGAKILAQGPKEKTAIEATLALAGLKNDWTMVPAGFSPEPLVAGAGDGYTGFGTNQPITLERMGLKRDKDFFFRSFSDLGLKGYDGLAFCKREFLQNNRDVLVGYVRSLVRANIENEKDPAYAAKLAVDKYGADYGLNLAQQTRQNELLMPFVHPGMKPGFKFLTMDRKAILDGMYATARATGRTNLPDIDRIVDFSIAEDAQSA